MEYDSINKPRHYNSHPSGVPCIEIVRNMSYNVGTAMAYLWRHEHKGNPRGDLQKAIWHIADEIDKLLVEESALEMPAEYPK